MNFFLELHNRENIHNDILEGNTYVIGCGAAILGTGTMNQNTISRVYVTPNNQHEGIGSKLMDYLEEEIIKNYSYVNIDASLPGLDFDEYQTKVPKRVYLQDLKWGCYENFDIEWFSKNKW